MEIIAYILLGIGALAAIYGGIWIIIRAFKTGIGWGLFTLLCQFGPIIWIITHWEDGKLPFLIYLCGIVIAVGGFLLLPKESGFAINTGWFSTRPSISSEIPKPPVAPPKKDINQELLAATEYGDLDKVQDLLNQGAKINTTDKNGLTPLFIATQKGNIDLVKLLLDKNADINLTNNFGMTALFPAAQAGRTAIVKLLIEKGIQVNARTGTGWTALMAAVSNGRKNSTRVLIENGAEVNASTNTGQTVLSLANRPEIIEMIRAASEMKPEQAKKELENKNIEFNEAIFLKFAEQGDIETIRLFLIAGMNPNVKDNDGFTALMYTANKGYPELARLLIEKGAEVNLKTATGWTALKLATTKRFSQIIQLLQTAGAKE